MSVKSFFKNKAAPAIGMAAFGVATNAAAQARDYEDDSRKAQIGLAVAANFTEADNGYDAENFSMTHPGPEIFLPVAVDKFVIQRDSRSGKVQEIGVQANFGFDMDGSLAGGQWRGFGFEEVTLEGHAQFARMRLGLFSDTGSHLWQEVRGGYNILLATEENFNNRIPAQMGLAGEFSLPLFKNIDLNAELSISRTADFARWTFPNVHATNEKGEKDLGAVQHGKDGLTDSWIPSFSLGGGLTLKNLPILGDTKGGITYYHLHQGPATSGDENRLNLYAHSENNLLSNNRSGTKLKWENGIELIQRFGANGDNGNTTDSNPDNNDALNVTSLTAITKLEGIFQTTRLSRLNKPTYFSLYGLAAFNTVASNRAPDAAVSDTLMLDRQNTDGHSKVSVGLGGTIRLENWKAGVEYNMNPVDTTAGKPSHAIMGSLKWMPGKW